MDFLISNKPLNPNEIFKTWYEEYKSKNFGAFITFTGIVRAENEITGLSFDIYEPILKIWFKKWQDRAKNDNATILFAHSKGDVLVHECSYLSAVLSPQRKIGLKLINDFVEDFKKNAPIWKYDLKQNGRIYAMDRSQKIDGAGIFAK